MKGSEMDRYVNDFLTHCDLIDRRFYIQNEGKECEISSWNSKETYKLPDCCAMTQCDGFGNFAPLKKGTVIPLLAAFKQNFYATKMKLVEIASPKVGIKTTRWVSKAFGFQHLDAIIFKRGIIVCGRALRFYEITPISILLPLNSSTNSSSDNSIILTETSQMLNISQMLVVSDKSFITSCSTASFHISYFDLPALCKISRNHKQGHHSH
ncbi:hypothetical protein EGR_05435 [Echinococcus granulosus]|uniref:Uncharacterized protein n=1 Tax=Echinococcus granulosus TaxID=6210 RepID=W6UEZ3_ECHGR|nr:hypothetical protein EGR_05435 [Echinococcus granulosus]EUB59673.1 hypothetical protein EGR_05435 [Echinococcus granulosus]